MKVRRVNVGELYWSTHIRRLGPKQYTVDILQKEEQLTEEADGNYSWGNYFNTEEDARKHADKVQREILYFEK